jgi:hypothetical protein
MGANATRNLLRNYDFWQGLQYFSRRKSDPSLFDARQNIRNHLACRLCAIMPLILFDEKTNSQRTKLARN